MKLKESLTTDEQKFISKLIDKLDASYCIDWDKSEYSICLFPEKLDAFNEAYRKKIPTEYFNVLSRCLHPETWEKLSELTSRFWRRTSGELVIPHGVQTIPGYAFESCRKLTSINIPSSVTSIGGHAFQYCDSLASVTIPSSVARIGSYAFQYCASLRSVTIPPSVTRISPRAFQYCDSLASVTIPDSVASIGCSAFYGCQALRSVAIPSSVTSIGDYAFQNCSSLSSVTIPSSVTSIGYQAFYKCPKLVIETEDSNIAAVCKKMHVKVKLIESLNESRRQTAVKSNGVYSVLRDEWIKEPVAEDIPEINEEEFEKLFKEWEDKYFALLDEVE